MKTPFDIHSVKRLLHHGTPPTMDDAASRRIRARLIAASEMQRRQSPQEIDQPAFLSFIPMSMKRSLIVLSSLAALVACGLFGYVWFGPESISDTRTIPVILTDADVQLKLTADSGDILGVDTATSFTLTSSLPIDVATVEGNLQIEPAIAYAVHSSDTNTFTITPSQPLDDGTIYQFSMVAQTVGDEQKREYQWAYQTKDTFKVMSTVPRDQATTVPRDSGIEITFSHENFREYEQYVSISPAVSGRFEQYRKTLVFVPDSLAPMTVYTVTVRAGLPLDGSDDTLVADYQFQFETDQSQESYGYFDFTKEFFEYPSSEAPVMTVSEYNSGLTAIPVQVYAFTSFREFTDAVQSFASLPYWAAYAWRTHPYATDSLTLQATFDAEKKSSDYFQYIEFPEALPAGYYLVQVPYGDTKAQAFLQVGQLTASYQSSPDNSFIWVHDLGTQAPVSDASIGYSGDAAFSAETDRDGLASFATPSDIADRSSDAPLAASFFTVHTERGDLLVPVIPHYEFNGFMNNASRDYWTYLYTNRTLYSPDDSVKFWGVIRPRADVRGPQAATITFTKSANYYTSMEDEIIATQEVPVSDYGTYEGSIDYRHLNPGSYRLGVTVDGTEILSQYVEVATYTKPAYKIEVSTPKKAIFEGEDAIFDITAMFYDGTPVGNLELQYTGALGTGTVTTDADGTARVVLGTSYSGGYYPEYEYFSVHPTNAELSGIYTDAYIYSFGPRYTVDSSVNQEGFVSGSVHAIDLETINAAADEFSWEYEGDPIPNAAIAMTVFHEYYTKTETGTRYDIISKKTYKTYDYQSHSDEIATLSAVTNTDGAYTAGFQPAADQNYRIEVRVTDPDGREATSTSYLYQGSWDYWAASQGFVQYHVAVDAQDESGIGDFRPGDDVAVSLYRNDEIVGATQEKNILFFKGQTNLFDLYPTNQPGMSFTFRESYAPNIYVYGLYFDGRGYALTDGLQLNYDRSLKALQIQLSPDQPAYRPGEDVTLDIHVTDSANNPVTATVNVSAIDEALTAIQWANPAEVLSTLYQYLPSPIVYSYQTHKAELNAMAEGGGCFSGDTTILMADGTTKHIGEIRIGDSVATHPAVGSDELVSATVTNTFEHRVAEYLVINGSLRVTPEHVVLLNGSWQTIGSARVGDWLIDQQGSRVVIHSIIRQYHQIDVYNLTTEPYHTFIADGIYVHNEKGGGRQNFQDIAYFGSTTTDRSGNASVTFKLPDNITSWQTTVHALTKDLQAQAAQTALIATQPYFVDVAVAGDYVVGDAPQVLLRSFGRAVDPDTAVTYTITFPGFSEDVITRSAGAQDTVAVGLPDFPAGTHQIRVEGKQGSSTDAVIKTMQYHDSHITVGTTQYYRLESAAPLSGSADRRTSLVFTNLERGQFYRDLQALIWSYGDRIEQQLGRYQAQSLLNEYFGEDGTLPAITFTDYQLPEGGISLLPYSSAELLTTAKTFGVAPGLFDAIAGRDYFYSVLNNRQSNTDEIVYALLGLANLGEPVLTDINIFMAHHDVSAELKLYLARAVAQLGASEYAATLLQEVLNEHGHAADPYIEVQLGTTQDDYTEYTYQAAVLAAAVSSEEAPKLYQYALAHPANLTLHTIDQLAYIQTAVPLLSGDPVRFSYTLDGETKSVILEDADTYALSVTPEQLSAITFSGIEGEVGVISSYQQPVDPASALTDANLSITREYTVNGQPTKTFRANDIVRVTLKPSISSGALDTEYQVTDYLPAGLKLLSNLSSRNVPYEQLYRYPYEVNGQAVKFWTGRTSQEFYYYALVTGKGTFTADAPVVQGFVVRSSVNYGTSTSVTIE